MQCYSELLPPSGVTHALTAAFTAAETTNLVVVRTSLLQIFSQKQAGLANDTKLGLLAEYKLSGSVTALDKVKVAGTKSGGDAILLAFRNAKLSLIEWDPQLHKISTISIHYYEQNDLQSIPWLPDPKYCVNHLSVDPSSRCAAYHFSGTRLAIIPFHQAVDDLAMDDFDNEDEMDLTQSRSPTKDANGDSAEHKTPYLPSFVLPLTALDSMLLHPIDMVFLHEYRDPTIGVLYSTQACSSNMAYERKDIMIYAVYALELENKQSTTLLSVQKLPNDLHRVVALPPPVGGALLIGGNELIHIDQGGKPNAIAVNELAREASSFSMVDQSGLRMRLEGSQIQCLDPASGEFLILLKTGNVAVLKIRLDGRTVSGLSARHVGAQHTSSMIRASSSCTASLGQGRIFVGSEEADSILLATGRKVSGLKRQASRAQLQPGDMIEENGASEASEDDLDDDDDLYGLTASSAANGQTDESSMVEESNFRLMDRLPCVAPIREAALGRTRKRKRDEPEDNDQNNSEILDLAVAYGRENAGGLAFFSREIDFDPIAKPSFERVDSIWTFESRSGQSGSRKEAPAQHQVYAILSRTDAEGKGNSGLAMAANGNLEERDNTEFDGSAGGTIAVGQMRPSNSTVHVMTSEIRVYDKNLGLSQIFPIIDEEEGQMAQVIRASFVSPFLVLVKDDHTVMLLKSDRSGELDEIELQANIQNLQVVSAHLYLDLGDFFQTSRFSKASPSENIMLSVLTLDGKFHLLCLANLGVQVFKNDGLPFLPSLLAQEPPLPKHWRHKDTIIEAALFDLGDEIEHKPYLHVMNASGDVVVYEPFSDPAVVGTYKFLKLANFNASSPGQPQDDDESALGKPAPFRPLSDQQGLELVIVLGSSPAAVVKRAGAPVRIYPIRSKGIRSISELNDSTIGNGLLLVEHDGSVSIVTLPTAQSLGWFEWIVDRYEMGQDISSISYYATTHCYAVVSDDAVEYQLPQDDEWHPEWHNEQTTFLPTSSQSSLKLLSANTHAVIDQYNFEVAEQVLCVKNMNLELSEETHERKEMIVVGTGFTKGENVVARGNLYIFDVVDVVPNPDVPESDHRLKLVTKEDMRGAVSAISEIGSQGYLLAAQGQKCMVRGLQEDKSVLPVAFLDMRYYVHVAKELKGTGMCILGDGFSGMWLMGYSEEPYKMQLLGRDLEDPAIVSAEFLPDDKELFIITSDGDGMLKVLQYDPENPKAERGTKLLQRSTFNSGAFPTTMTLLPQTPLTSEANSDPESPSGMQVDSDTSSNHLNGQRIPSAQTQQILLTTQEGSLGLISPLTESMFRRLYTLQNILLAQLEHPCGLNPRAYREIETDGIGGRGMIDGNVVRRWLEQSTQHKNSTADKAGASIWEIQQDLECCVLGGGLSFI